MATDNMGNLYAAGAFTNAAGKLRVARWNGTTWQDLGQGIPIQGDHIGGITTDNSGNVYVTVFWPSGPGIPVAKWNGNSWSQLSDGPNLKSCTVVHIILPPSGGPIATGAIIDSNNFACLLQWSGSSWAELTLQGRQQQYNYMTDYLLDAVGNSYLGLGGPLYQLYEHGNTGWRYIDSELIYQDSNAYSFSGIPMLDNAGTLYLALNCQPLSSNTPSATINQWDGSNWHSLPAANYISGNQVQVHCLTSDAQRSIYVVYTWTPNSSYSRADTCAVLKWNGNTWSQLGSLNYLYGSINAVITDANNNVYAAGTFSDSAGHPFVAVYKP